MIGKAFLTVDGTISWRSRQALEENPSFAKDNYDLILKIWSFNTDDKDDMRRLFTSFSDLKLNQRDVIDFAKSIGFDIAALRQAVYSASNRPPNPATRT